MKPARCNAPVLDAEKRAHLCGEPATTERTVERGVSLPFCARHAAEHDAKRPALDWADPAAVTQWLDALRVAFGDLAAVPADMLLPVRQRALGHAEADRLFEEARHAVVALLDFAAPPEPESGDPAGNGGSPTH